jgi:hypothetical protein
MIDAIGNGVMIETRSVDEKNAFYVDRSQREGQGCAGVYITLDERLVARSTLWNQLNEIAITRFIYRRDSGVSRVRD